MDISFACIHCGQQLEVDEATVGTLAKCPTCGKELTVPPPDSAPVAAAAPQDVIFCSKCGQQNQKNSYQCTRCQADLHAVASAPPPAVPATTVSGKAIASMACSIGGTLMCLFIGQIVGLILGYSARKDIAKSEGHLTGDGFALAGIIVGWIGLALDVILVLFYGGLLFAGSMM